MRMMVLGDRNMNSMGFWWDVRAFKRNDEELTPTDDIVFVDIIASHHSTLFPFLSLPSYFNTDYQHSTGQESR